MTDYWSKLVAYNKPRIQESKRTPSRINSTKQPQKHISLSRIILKLQELKTKKKFSR